MKIVENVHFFITLDEEEGPDETKNLCREYTLPRSEEASRVRGWILRNTKIVPVLDVKGCFHQGRYGIEVMIESLFRDRTVSWVRIVNGTHKYLTETSETISLEHRVTGKPVVKARPQLKSAVTLSPFPIPIRERKWIDINPERFCEDCFIVSKAMIRLLRHDPSIPREDDVAVRFDDIIWKFSRRSSMVLLNGHVMLGFCMNPDSSKHFLYFRAIQGHSGGNLVDLHYKRMYCCRMTSLSTSTTSEM